MKLLAAIATLCSAMMSTAAFAASGISGEVQDVYRQPVEGAEVQAQSEATGSRWKTQSGPEGRYSLSPLPTGSYKVTVRMPGFRTASRAGLKLDTDESLRLDFALELLTVHEVITVTTSPDPMNPATSSSLLVTRENQGARLPANGGDYRALFDLMPGVVTTPASTSDAGQFTSNGQRPNSNMFRVDGISSNTGVGNNILPGAFPGASLPAMTAIGSTENLVSNETAQSVELRTFDLAPEFGDRPGAEALVHTRSGGNRLHLEAFGYVRATDWNARDWFANSRGLGLYWRPSYYRAGGVFGGPLRRDRTFFFLSAEASKLINTGVWLTSVPSLQSRANAPEKLKPILDYYPFPTGPDLGGGTAEGLGYTNNTGTLLSTSLRLDQSLGQSGKIFLRLAESPSKSDSTRLNWASATLGMTLGHGSGIHDVRVSFSRADLLASWYGGGPTYSQAVLALAGLLPTYTFQPDGGVTLTGVAINPSTFFGDNTFRQTAIGLSVPGLGQFLSYGWGKARQAQEEVRETFARTTGRHEFRLGGDYIEQDSSRNPATYTVLGVAYSLQAMLDGKPLAITSSSPPQRSQKVHQVTLFAQDSFRVSDKLTLLYGLGWAITPPIASDVQVPMLAGLWNGAGWQNGASQVVNGTGQWPMRYGQIAPRFGMAYRVGGMIFRGGAGKFYDTTLGAAVNPINGAPFNSWLLGNSGAGSGSSLAPGGPGSSQDATDPLVQRFLFAQYPPLRLPASYQWRLALDKPLGRRGVASMAYVGALGRNLLGHQAYIDPSTGVMQRMITLTANSSHYEALQMRYSGNLLPGLYGSLSYTWSHSIDDGSQDSSIFLIHSGYRLSEAKGSSSFDSRQTLTAAMQYRIPTAPRLPVWMSGWSLSGTFRARAGFPIDVQSDDQPLGQGFVNVGRPDRVLGVPLWLAEPLSPGKRRLNPAAFGQPLAGAAGTLGRNSIVGNGLAQVDMSLRRDIPLFFGLAAEISVNVFNVLNHPAFANPEPHLSSPWFGQATSMQNMMLGSGSPNTGMPPLFQAGGSRSAEFSFRVSF